MGADIKWRERFISGAALREQIKWGERFINGAALRWEQRYSGERDLLVEQRYGSR